MKRIMMLPIILGILAALMVHAHAQTCDLSKAKTEMTAKTGIFKKGGHLYLYIGGKMQYGEIKYQGKYFYAHRTSSKRYPKGSLTRGQFRIKSKNRWYAYSGADGSMYTKNKYTAKGRFKRYIELAIRKDRTVRYVYNNASTVRGSIRYSTAERRLQRDLSFGEWKTIEGMQFIPDGWVDWQE